MVVGYPDYDQPGVVVGDNLYGHIVVMEIILAWLWLVGIVAFLSSWAAWCKGVDLVGLIV